MVLTYIAQSKHLIIDQKKPSHVTAIKVGHNHIGKEEQFLNFLLVAPRKFNLTDNYYLLANSPMSKPCFIVLKFSQQQVNIPIEGNNSCQNT